MGTRTRRRLELDQATKALILAAIVFVFAMMLVPVYQIGHNHEIRIRIAASQENIRQLEDTQRTLKSEISVARSPESLIDSVVEYSIEYSEIDPDKTVLVARSDV